MTDKKTNLKTERILLAVSTEELVTYKKKAHEEYKTLSKYIRDCIKVNLNNKEENNMIKIDKEILKKTINLVVDHIEYLEEESIPYFENMVETIEDAETIVELKEAIASEKAKAEDSRNLLGTLHSSLVGEASEGQKNYHYIKGYTTEEFIDNFILN